MNEGEKKIAGAAAIYVSITAFAVLIAYTQRIPVIEELMLPKSGIHGQMMKLSMMIFGEKMLIGRALPTVFAGTLAVLLTFLLVAKRNVLCAVVSASAMLGCFGFVFAARNCDSRLFTLVALLAAVYLLSFLRTKFRAALLLGWMLIWAIFGWDGFQNDYSILQNLKDFSILAPLTVVFGGFFLIDLLKTKNPTWQQILLGLTVFLAIAPKEVWFYSLPLAGWCAGEFLMLSQYKFRRIVLLMLKFVPFAGIVVLSWAIYYWRGALPEYDTPIMIPIMMLAVLGMGSLAVKKLDEKNYADMIISASAFLSAAVFSLMVIEPYLYFTGR